MARLKCWFFAILLLLTLITVIRANKFENDAIEDNEFAEFEEFDDEGDDVVGGNNGHHHHSQQQQPAKESMSDPVLTGVPVKQVDDIDDSYVEEEDDEQFEFVPKESEKDEPVKPSGKQDELKITKIPAHLRANWESYYMEFSVIGVLILYMFNYFIGRSRNSSIASQWLEKNRDLLEANFALVGDDGKKEIENHGFQRESDNIFTLYASGRVNIDGMITELALLKRQDLVSSIVTFFRPTTDKIVFKLFLNSDATDNFVFAISSKKAALKLAKEMNDISMFCPERKSAEKYGICDDYLIMNEIGEAANFIFDSKMTSIFNKNTDLIEFLHISDQFCGVKSPEETTMTKLPEVKRMFIMSINITSKLMANPDEFDRLKTLLQSVFYLVDRLKRFKLNRESKSKSEKNRQKLEKLVMQQTHLARQELAQQKREEKRRAEKERILNESDPEKQRRLEDQQIKRDKKKNGPKMKSLKVKSM